MMEMQGRRRLLQTPASNFVDLAAQSVGKREGKWREGVEEEEGVDGGRWGSGGARGSGDGVVHGENGRGLRMIPTRGSHLSVRKEKENKKGERGGAAGRLAGLGRLVAWVGPVWLPASSFLLLLFFLFLFITFVFELPMSSNKFLKFCKILNNVLKHFGTCFLTNTITSHLMHFGLYGYLGNIYESRI
jgi:hypothetical protein